MKASSRLKLGVGLVLCSFFVLPDVTSQLGRGRVEARLENRLVSVTPLVGAACPIPEPPAADILRLDTAVPINPVTVAMALQQQQGAQAPQGTIPAANPADPNSAKKLGVASRRPIRTIRDQYPQFSAVAVDAERNEAVVADENLFQLLVFDRMTNTPPRASMSEPKRQIRGPATYLELQCAVYIDPKNGNIYSLNNDTERHMTVFDRTAQGDASPNWKLHTPMGSFGLAVDEETQELLITAQHESSVSWFPKEAREDAPPTGVLQGDKTLLADPHGIAIDTKQQVFFVANFGSVATPLPNFTSRMGPGPHWPLGAGEMVPGSGRFLPVSITVYDKKARGNTPPVRVITGSNTQLNWPAGLFVDSGRGELYVANDGGNSILVFSTTANGNAAPIRVLKGPRTKMSYPSSVFIDLKNDEMWVANFGNHRATVYPRTASGDVAPIREIRSAPEGTPAPTLANVRIDYDTRREQILAPNCVAHPQIAIFPRLANGNAETVRRIEGQRTLLARTTHSIFYDHVNDELVVPSPFAQAILFFRGEANGEEAPIRMIQGAKTGLVFSDENTADPVHGEVFVPTDYPDGDAMIQVFDRTAQGDVAPIRRLGGPDSRVGTSISVDYEHDLILTGGGNEVRIFNRTDTGNARPVRVITGGPRSGTAGVIGRIRWIPGTRNFLAATRPFGAKTAGDAPGAPDNYQSPEDALTYVGVWSIDDSGDVPPRYTIAHNILKEFRNFAVDPKNKEIMISDKTANAIYSFSFPEAWETFAPVRVPPGPSAGRGGTGAQ